MSDEMKLFAGSASHDFAAKICKYLGCTLGDSETKRFPNDNLFVHINENVREVDCFVVQTSVKPVSDNLMEAMIMMDALRRASAKRITLVMPYYAYARSDKKDMPRIAITASLVARLLETAGVSRLLCMDLHAEQIQGFFHIPVDQLIAAPIICGYLREKNIQDLVIVSPDVGSAKRAREYADRLKCDLAIVEKVRDKDSGEVKAWNIIGDIKGMNAVLIDDEINSGGSIIEARRICEEFGAKDIYVAATHAVFAEGAAAKLVNAGFKEVIVTDTVPILEKYDSDVIHVESVSDLFAHAVKNIHTGSSVSKLFK
jgi:ribose-phosphate pyrophosphokinase